MTDRSPGERAKELEEELERLRGYRPYQILGVEVDAGPDAARAAYLSRVKAWHPNRFAREAAEIRKLANARFLMLRKAYDDFSAPEVQRKVAAKRGQGRARVPATSPPRPATPPAQAQPEAPPQAQPEAPPQAPPPDPEARKRTRRLTSSPRARVLMNKARLATQPPAARPPEAKPPSQVHEMLDAVKTRADRFDRAVRWLYQGRLQEAREQLHIIASEDPHNKRYRAHLAYAMALEHKESERLDDAIRELERALSLEPSLEPAQRALAQLKARRGGFFSKLFGR